MLTFARNSSESASTSATRVASSMQRSRRRLLAGIVIAPQLSAHERSLSWGPVWHAHGYEVVVLDAAGNPAQATFSGGKITVAGAPQPIAAGTFVVPSNTVVVPDAGVPLPLDLGAQPDMAMPLPAVLNAITVMPSSVTMPGMPVTVTVSWTDNLQILK